MYPPIARGKLETNRALAGVNHGVDNGDFGCAAVLLADAAASFDDWPSLVGCFSKAMVHSKRGGAEILYMYVL